MSQGIFISSDSTDRVKMLNEILPKAVACDKNLALAKKEKRELNPAERALLEEVQSVVNDLIQVNTFEKLGIGESSLY